MPRKIHFINPATSQQACGVAIDSLHLRLTDDITQVTCQHCLNTASGKKHAGGKPRHGADPKVSITLKIDRELRDKAKAKKINCSRLLEHQVLAQIEEDRANSLAPDLEDAGICE